MDYEQCRSSKWLYPTETTTPNSPQLIKSSLESIRAKLESVKEILRFRMSANPVAKRLVLDRLDDSIGVVVSLQIELDRILRSQ